MKFGVRVMKSAKIFIIFTLFSAFAFQVSAQDEKPKIVWKNLQAKYESFYDIKPQIINDSDSLIYILDPLDLIDFERFDEQSNSWIVSREGRCGTGYKPSISKIKSKKEIPFYYYEEKWDGITIQDSIGDDKFKKSPEYKGVGKYRFKFLFGIKKSNIRHFLTYSPEFEVIEKDFKKYFL
jgi:hypothetical protein